MVELKYPPILKATPYVGSATNRVVHKTDSNCPQVLEIPPNERWYIKDIPHDGNYVLCAFCFPQTEDGTASPDGSPADSTCVSSVRAVSSAGVKPTKADVNKKKGAGVRGRPSSAQTQRRLTTAAISRTRAAGKTSSAKKAAAAGGAKSLSKAAASAGGAKSSAKASGASAERSVRAETTARTRRGLTQSARSKNAARNESGSAKKSASEGGAKSSSKTTGASAERAGAAARTRRDRARGEADPAAKGASPKRTRAEKPDSGKKAASAKKVSGAKKGSAGRG